MPQPLALPVRVVIRSAVDKGEVHFTIHNVQFTAQPQADDFIAFRYRSWPNLVVAKVLHAIHACGDYFVNHQPLTIHCQINAGDLDDMTEMFERFKELSVTDVEITPKDPPAYYHLFSIFKKILGKSTFDNSDSRTALGLMLQVLIEHSGVRLTRALTEAVSLSKVESLLVSSAQPTRLIELFRHWDAQTGLAKHLANIQYDEAIAILRERLPQMRGFKPEELPATLRDTQ